MPAMKCDSCGGHNVVTRVIGGMAKCGPCAAPNSNSAALELAHAERDEALIALQCFERILARTGGHHYPADQATIREGQAVLAKHGRFKNEGVFPPVAPAWANDPPPWKRKA